MLKKSDKIALVSAAGVGDGLLTLVLANNLQQNGYSVVTFSSHMTQLRDWFPQQNIEAFPSLENAKNVLSNFDKVFSTDGAFTFNIKEKIPNYHVFIERELNKNQTMLQNFADICKNIFQLETVTVSNNIIPPKPLTHRKYKSRVLIHPMSTKENKNWSAHKFIKLARKLKKFGYEPIFAVSPAEQVMWVEILKNEFPLPVFKTLSELAEFIYESGYLIGNDSGNGHLASNLDIPTLSIFARQTTAKLWRPGWGKNLVVTSTFSLPGARVQTKYWQKLLTVRKVTRGFRRLVETSTSL